MPDSAVASGTAASPEVLRGPDDRAAIRQRLETEAHRARSAALGRNWNAGALPRYRQALGLEEQGLDELRDGRLEQAARTLAEARRLYDGVAEELSVPTTSTTREATQAVAGTADQERSPQTVVSERVVSERTAAGSLADAAADSTARSGSGVVAAARPASNAPTSPAVAPDANVSTPPGASTFPPAAAAAPAGRSPSVVSEEQRIRAVLRRYQSAYERLDAAAARAVWPTVDARALARAFGGLRMQQLEFRQCDITVQDRGASAACRGSATYVRRVGSRDARTEPRRWTFGLRKAKDDWVIVEAKAE